MPRWTTRQLVTKSMANSGGDGETLGAAESRPGKRAGLIMWVASATQLPAAPIANSSMIFALGPIAPLTRRPRRFLALTHVDELRPAVEWTPPYDITAPGFRRHHGAAGPDDG
jgi:hypothetical protein